MEHQFLHLIIAPLVKQPKCELTSNEHFKYIRFLWVSLTAESASPPLSIALHLGEYYLLNLQSLPTSIK
jgi:hypothetical protein